MDFRTFILILRLHWRLVVGALLACLIGAAAVTVLQTKSYQASAAILISFAGEKDLPDVYYGTQAAQLRLSSYAAVAGGSAVAQRAVDQLHAPISADALVSQTHVAYTPQSTMFTITVTDIDPNRVAALTGALADQFAALVPTLTAPPAARPTRETNKPTAPDVQQTSLDAAAAEESPGTDVPAPSATPIGQPVPVAMATVVERPGVPSYPIRPVPVRNMAMGLIAGVLLGIGAALTRNAADRTLRDREKLEQLSELPTLAELVGRRGNALRFGIDSSFDDAVRGMRNRLLRAMPADARRVLLASPFGGEGTTTTALNLAMSFAELGEKVLLIEGDPRRPSIAGLLNVDSAHGLSNVLSSPTIALDAIQPTAVKNLSILAARTVRRDVPPVSAYLPRTVTAVLEALAIHFDRVVVDGPPVLVSSDSALLSGAVDATLLVVRGGRSTFDEVSDAQAALRATSADVVGTVLTDARLSRHTRAADKTYRAKLKEPT